MVKSYPFLSGKNLVSGYHPGVDEGTGVEISAILQYHAVLIITSDLWCLDYHATMR